MTTMIKRLVRQTISLLPAKQALLAKGALLPPTWKSPSMFKFLSALASSTKASFSLRTNLGIAGELACEIPQNHHIALYGRPDQYIGERGPLALTALFANHTSAFVDIGSHIGYYVYFVRNKLPASKPIYYFEPDPDLYAVISANVQSNKLENIQGFQQAVGTITGTSKFYKNLTDSASNSLHDSFSNQHETRVVEISVMAFSDFVRRENLTNLCVKVDVENAERDFVEGANDSLQTVPYLIMEVLGPAVQSGFIKDMINVYHYYAYYINDYCLEHSANGDFTYVAGQWNWLFARENPDQLREILKGSAITIMNHRDHK